MPSLYLMRHGKSDHGEWGSDHARPLEPRGRQAAKLMGGFLSERGEVPHLVLTSTAVRARTTAELVAEAGGWEDHVHLEERIYGASVDELVELLRGIDETSERVLLVGHEPTLSGLIERLTGARTVFPTCCLAKIDLAGPWSAAGAGVLKYLLPPRILQPGTSG